MSVKRWKGMAGICLLTAGILTGCGEGAGGTQEAAAPAVSLDWYVNFSWYSTTWGKNLVSRAITDKTGVTINYIAPKGSEKEKLNAMMASDTLTDLLTIGWWEDEYKELVNQGKVYDLKELASQYCPEFNEVINPVTADWYTDSAGSLYAYPNSSYTPQDMEQYDNLYSNQNFLVRKDIYEALGSPDMTTPEGFMDAVRRAAAQYPQVDGQPLIPIGSDEFTENGCNSFENYLLSFLAVPYEKDGAYYDRTTDPDYLAWLRVFRQMGQEEYLKNDIFIDKRSQLEDKIADGRYFCLFYQNMDIAVQQRMLQQKHPEWIYVAVDGPKNAAGDDPVLPIAGIHGWTVTMIPKTCKDPEQAIRFLTYLISEEGQKMLYLGVEGEMYQMVDGKPQVKPEVTELLNKDRLAYDETYGADDTYWMLQNNAMQLQWEYNTGDPISQMKQYTYPYVAYTGQYDLDFSEDVENNRLYVKMQQLWGSALRDLLLAESDARFDALLQEYLEVRQAEGYDAFAVAATEEYRRNKEKLGLTDE
ncbi:MAG: extracellular solute-binding protein [Lachnospiraceae bacterium]|nr:extracellular solute-binding protein [Lachnospiraceae bacterium]